MIKTIIAVLVVFPMFSLGQKLTVVADDPRSKEAFIRQLKYDGYKIDSIDFDYSLNYFVTGQYKLVAFKKPYQAYATITDKKGKEITRSKEVKTNPAALNGFNAAYGMANMIIKRYLPGMLSQLKK
ncbi:hypothetical protein [Niabella soli]|uniref:Uncharacterized protein n=1 Tax=Niabella soli DSM 19437 TaxID=929713 RepID=W0F4U1_9BACT|nr:hypothetical protein [Niabella soli]AHF18027.1 hypothetical protein NIASO_18965 [Niabella soli DSM 19437]